MDRTIYDTAVGEKEHELVLELEATERLRRHSTEMQRNIDTRVEARKLRKQLIDMEQELTEATNEQTRQQAEDLHAARVVMQDLTRQEASVCLDLRRASKRLTEAQNH